MRAPVPDGPLARTLLGVWSVFVPSVCFLICCTPYAVFERAIGWQPSHGAIWLGALSLAPVGPGLRGLLAATRAVVGERGYPGHLVRRFVDAIRSSSPALRAAWCWLPGVTVLLAYDVALAGPLVLVVGIALLVLLIGASAADRPGQRGSALLQVVLVSAVRRPQAPLSWLFLLTAATLATTIPLIGPQLLLVMPGAWAAAVDVVNRAWGFTPPRSAPPRCAAR
jgi:hypothetical protein